MRSNSSNLPLVIMLVLIIILMSALNPRFLSVGNIVSMTYQLPIIAILSIGMMVSILTGGINLALIATSNFTGIVVALILQAIMG
jgi:simple sugar transport system permease protein